MLNIILQTSPVNFAGEHELLEQMFEKFPFSLHVRKPGFSEGQLEKFLLGVNEEIRSMSVLHGSRDMAESFGLAGFALPASHLELASACDLKRFAVCRSLEELGTVPSVDGAILYPVFDSYTEIGAKGKFAGESVLAYAKTRIFAAGGVDEDRFKEIEKLGYAGAVVCGAVWNYADPLPAWTRVCRKVMMSGL